MTTTSITFSGTRPHMGGYIVYIAGIETPVISVGLSNAAGGIVPSATIQVAPDPILARLGAEDRVEVQVFYLDDTYGVSGSQKTFEGETQFRLAFEGEILGWSYTNESAGRAISFTCVNFLTILELLQADYLSGIESLASHAANPTNGESATFTVNGFTFPWNQLFFGFEQTNEDIIKRPYDLIMNVLLACSSVKNQTDLGSVVATNFFARYLRRTALIHRFIPSPIIERLSDDSSVFPVLGALRDEDVITALFRDAAQTGMRAPIWSVIQQLFSRMYYETGVITTAPIAQVDRTPKALSNGEVLGPPKWKLPIVPAKSPEYLSAEQQQQQLNDIKKAYALIDAELGIGLRAPTQREIAEAERLKEAERKKILDSSAQQPADPLKPNCLINYVTKPHWLFGIPPACNIIFPSMVQQIHFEENYQQELTRLYLNDTWYADKMGGTSNEQIKAVATMRAGYPDQVQLELEKRYGIVTSAGGNPVVSGKNFLVWPEEFYKGPLSLTEKMPSWFNMLFQKVQTKQTAEQQAAVNALEQLTHSTDKQATIDTLKAQGLLPSSVTNVADATKILEYQSQEAAAEADVIRKAYARYEYFRNRSQAFGGAVITTFNPYIVAGYTAFIFDKIDSGQHLYAYVTNVRHDLSPDGWQTTVSFTQAQFIDEHLHEIFDARVGNTPFGVLEDLNSGPPHPVTTLRTTLQTQTGAEDYFSRLFHQGRDYPETQVKKAAFDITKAIVFVMPSGDRYTFDDVINANSAQGDIARRKEKAAQEDAELTEKVEAYEQELKDYYAKLFIPFTNTIIQAKVTLYRSILQSQLDLRRADELAKNPEVKTPSNILETYTRIEPSTHFAKMFDNPDVAMAYISRPVCTLDEYIAFRGSKGQKVGTVFPNDPRQGKGAVFYEKILNFTAGPGNPPTFDENNNLVSPAINDVPDLRSDWQSRLNTYRSRIIKRFSGWYKTNK